MSSSTSGARASGTTAAAPGNAALVVTLTCWAMVVIEGYDLISFGGVLPVLIKSPGSGFTAASAGVVAALVFVGATIGALSSGWLSDRVGRRPVAIGCLVWFSIFTGCCGFADEPFSLGALRLLAGIGIGGIVPATSALTLEYAVVRHRTLVYTLMISGVPVGGVIAAVTGMTVIPTLGWHWVFFIALLPAAIALPFALRLLPESLVFLERKGRHARAAALRTRYGMAAPPAAKDEAEDETGGDAGGPGIFSPGYRAATLLFGAASFFGLLTWFGLGTWLPGILREMGYDLGSSLTFLLTLNLGAIAGSIVMAVATDRFGSKRIVTLTYVVMALALLVFLKAMPEAALLLAIAVAGAGGHGGQILINRFVSRSYGTRHRATALGWSLGAGRPGTILGPIIIGVLVTGGAPQAGFVFFACCALAASLLLLIVPRTPTYREIEL